MSQLKPGQLHLRVREKLQSNLREFSSVQLQQMSREDGCISNVLAGVDKECFGLFGEKEFSAQVIIYYINGEGEDIASEVLTMNLADREYAYLLFAYCGYICTHYTHIDVVACFNLFQHQVRTYLEYHDYRTYSDDLFSGLKDSEVTLIDPHANGFVYIPRINKLEFYRRFFDNRFAIKKHQDANGIYLLLNTENNHIKIGRSKTMLHREKTLQSQQPVIELITWWTAPLKEEKSLHQMFAGKRLRGEWFTLTFHDLEQIKIKMQQYQ